MVVQKEHKKRTLKKQKIIGMILRLERKQMARSKKYKELLMQDLQDPKEAIAYLNAALEESQKGDEESQKLLLIALKNVADAQGGVAKLSKKTGLGRESLYKTLSLKGNPRFNTLASLLNAMGFELTLSLSSEH